MMTAYDILELDRVETLTALHRRTAQLLEAQREIARLIERVRNLTIENQLLSDRLARVEVDSNENR